MLVFLLYTKIACYSAIHKVVIKLAGALVKKHQIGIGGYAIKDKSRILKRCGAGINRKGMCHFGHSTDVERFTATTIALVDTLGHRAVEADGCPRLAFGFIACEQITQIGQAAGQA